MDFWDSGQVSGVLRCQVSSGTLTMHQVGPRPHGPHTHVISTVGLPREGELGEGLIHTAPNVRIASLDTSDLILVIRVMGQPEPGG